MSKQLLKCAIILCGLSTLYSYAVLVKNDFGKNIFLYIVSHDNESFYSIRTTDNQKDIGNDLIDELMVSRQPGLVKNIYQVTREINVNGNNEDGTKIRDNEMMKYRHALTKLPNAVITIIPDPTMPSRPIALLPTKELDEILLKEYQTKAKPEIQAAGKQLPNPVHLPTEVANIAASYTAPEE